MRDSEENGLAYIGCERILPRIAKANKKVLPSCRRQFLACQVNRGNRLNLAFGRRRASADEEVYQMGKSVTDGTEPQTSFVRRAGLFLVGNPLTQIVVGFLMVGVSTSIAQQLGRLLPSFVRVPAVTLLGTAAALGAYSLFVRLYERRSPAEIGPTTLPRGLPVGFALGAALLLTSAGLIHAGGWSLIAQTAPRADWIRLIGTALAIQFGTAVVEELLLRGVMFRVIEQSLGSWVALVLSALFFGLLHVGNPNATWAAALGLSLQAGVLLAAAYMVSRSLWLPIGLHWGWNAVQAGVVGGTVSGHSASAIVTTQPVGPTVFSGGAFGLEGSIVATGVCAALATVFCFVAVRLGRTKSGFWVTPTETIHAKPDAQTNGRGI